MAEKAHTISPIELQKYLRDSDYPVNKSDLRSIAERNGAPEEVLEVIDHLPGDRFDSPAAVQKVFGETH